MNLCLELMRRDMLAISGREIPEGGGRWGDLGKGQLFERSDFTMRVKLWLLNRRQQTIKLATRILCIKI